MVPVASTPSIMTRPPVGSSSPAMMLKMVLLPHPDGPIRLTKRPCGIDSVTGASAWKTPVGVLNVMLASSTQSFGVEGGMHAPARPCRGTEFPMPCNYIAKAMPAATGVYSYKHGGADVSRRSGASKAFDLRKVLACAAERRRA